MPFPLHKSPRGLLELFRLRTLGANPPQFGDQIVPMVEVSEFYAFDLKTCSGSSPTTGAITGAGLSDTLTLSGPVRVHWAGANFIVGAAGATNVYLSIEYADNGGVIGLASQFFATLNALSNVRVSARLGGLVFPAGNNQRFRATISGTGAGVDHSIAPMLLMDVITGTQ